MANAQDPQPKKGLLTYGVHSWMGFCSEELVFDSEKDSLVRFRGMFVMPDWTGVEEKEIDLVVENSWVRLDQLAKTYYNDEQLFWVIAARNDLDLPDIQLYKGKRLKIPHPDWVTSELLIQANRVKKD